LKYTSTVAGTAVDAENCSAGNGTKYGSIANAREKVTPTRGVALLMPPSPTTSSPTTQRLSRSESSKTSRIGPGISPLTGDCTALAVKCAFFALTPSSPATVVPWPASLVKL
jgi:hypothetical protein